MTTVQGPRLYTTDWSLEPFAIASAAGRLLQLVEHTIKELTL